MPIDIAEYQPNWPEQGAEAVVELIGAVPGLFEAIEHVGSTAVPGLAAKPVIDLMASVSGMERITAERKAALTDIGYNYRDTGRPQRLFWSRESETGARTHHLHVVTADTWETRNERLFRDHLRSHPDAAAEYARLKRRLAAEVGDDGVAYTTGRTKLIQRIVDREREARGLPLVPVWDG